MKHYIYLFILCLTGLFFVSCEDIFDNKSESYLEADKVDNPETINITVMGCYNGLQSPLYYEWMLTELRSDNALQGQPNSSSVENYAFNDLDMFRPSPSLNRIYSYWLASYHNISNANNVILNVNKQELTTLLKQYKGEALFIRSYHYFNLVRLFGPVFLITEPTQPTAAKKEDRKPVDEVYAQIIADLKLAADYLPESYSSDELGRATRWAAKALLAKVYLTCSGIGSTYLAEADDLLDELQRAPATNSIGLVTSSYADVFSITNEMNKEILFAVRYKAGGYGLGATFANDFAPLNSGSAVIMGNGRGWNCPTVSIYNAFDAMGDQQRKAVTLGIYEREKDTVYVKKFFSAVNLGNDAENDWPVLRYSDVLLMSAEVKARRGDLAGALTRLNLVHERAGLTAIPVINSLAVFMETLREERRLEFAFENQRFFDLVRWGIASQVLYDHIYSEEADFYSRFSAALGPRNGVDEWRLLLPIPQREIDTNNEIRITQNYGY
jgi:hypothetical protein